ncbi:large secreted protein [Streptantibioticus cattleyicolor NRRL 8057 = DSM 46488]|uniref:histidine kinase n=1 Tax=Streptantibioticus cattleyicolor (strain ATCC 35852 / DSM 46488 / JCM 4925 / NBRC 14057 / NRRL 8057) TaxID=1003195 RepID=G8WW16_STREN|nr:large secreted protein [Streptantibioticus cattleyicolor NRRL 8057 = DSM 46488]
MALLLVPLVSLVAIWAFAAWITSRGVFALFDVERVTDKIGYPVENAIEALAEERKAALVRLADPHRPGSLRDLRTAEQATDKAVGVVRDNSRNADLRNRLDAASLHRLDGLVAQAADLETVRRKVDDGQIATTAAFTAYNDEIDPYYSFFHGLNPLQSVALDRQARVLTELSRGREAAAREDAVYSAGLAAGRLTHAQQLQFADAVAQRRLLFDTYPQLLPASDSRLFDDYWNSATGRALRSAEDRIVGADVDAHPEPGSSDGLVVSAGDWQATAGSVLGDLASLDRQAAENYKGRVTPFAVGVLVKAGVAGGFGLLAVLVSVVVSLRTGRSLARDLSALRKEAQEASGTRLPRVMRRLAAGEEVDVDTEVPRLEYPEDEMGAVGRALNTLQRAAVEAAVRQADLRRGISDVFVNLARRNQVLLHRQLTLLDTMERRTEDARELADLFKLDHMTTRMRRHAEGLVILSGAAPSRQWRKPVPLMDVVRAAVAEVEDYERVEVRRLPRIGVAGPAVADITHLVAELIENATVFSPPHTTVQVHGERVANGFVLEIDDRGLGLTPDALLDANLRLAETPEFELSDTDRLGLFVVSRLAQRQGVRVSLRESPYGGTTAVVLIPTALLTEGIGDSDTGEQRAPAAVARQAVREPAGDRGLPDEIELPVTDGGGDEAFREWGLVAEAPCEEVPARTRRFEIAEQRADRLGLAPATDRSARPEGPEPSARPDAPVPLPRRRHAPVLVADNGRTVDGVRRTTAPGGDAAGREQRPAPQATPGGLPRRIRQASLAPQLRADDTTRTRTATPGAAAPATDDRDADEVRSRMASLQRGWQRGREEADDLTVPDRPTGPGGDDTGTTSEGDGR